MLLIPLYLAIFGPFPTILVAITTLMSAGRHFTHKVQIIFGCWALGWFATDSVDFFHRVPVKHMALAFPLFWLLGFALDVCKIEINKVGDTQSRISSKTKSYLAVQSSGLLRKIFRSNGLELDLGFCSSSFSASSTFSYCSRPGSTGVTNKSNHRPRDRTTPTLANPETNTNTRSPTQQFSAQVQRRHNNHGSDGHTHDQQPAAGLRAALHANTGTATAGPHHDTTQRRTGGASLGHPNGGSVPTQSNRIIRSSTDGPKTIHDYDFSCAIDFATSQSLADRLRAGMLGGDECGICLEPISFGSVSTACGHMASCIQSSYLIVH